MCIKAANKHYAVIGRIPGDDEDSCYVFEAAGSDEAIILFKESIINEEGDISGLETDSDGEPIIFITSVLGSDSPIEILSGIC